MKSFWERLLTEKIAIHITDVEQGDTIVEQFRNKTGSKDSHFGEFYFEDFGEDTCINLSAGDGCWDYYDVDYYEEREYKIISYNDFINETIDNEVQDLPFQLEVPFNGKLVVIVGCSATGKDTILEELVKHGIARPVVSHTSRPIRSGEVEGVNYYYIDKLVAELMLREDEFVEHRTYETIDLWGNKNTWYYGISKAEISNLDFDHHNYVVIVDFQGLRLLEEYMTSQGLRDKMISVFIKSSSQTRLARSLNREGSMTEGQVAEVIRRYLDDKEKVEPAIAYCDIVLTNEKGQDLNRCVRAIEVIASI